MSNLLAPEEHLTLLGKPTTGVLPRSAILWITFVYVGLFLIRPWEVLIPELGLMRFGVERSFGIFMIVCVALTTGFRLPSNSQTRSVIAFTLALGICTVCARNTESAWVQFYIFLTIVICYFIFISVIRTPYSLVFIIVAYIAYMECYLAKSLWEFHVHNYADYKRGMHRFIGIETTYGAFNKIAVTIVASLPLCLFLWQYRKSITAKWPSLWRNCFSLGLIVYPVLGVWAIVLTKSRAGVIYLCVFFALWSLQKASMSRVLTRVGLALVLVLVGFQLIPIENQRRIRTIWDPSAGTAAEEASKRGRIDAIWLGVRIFKVSPVVGVGPRNFAGYRMRHIDGSAMAAHNLWAQMLAETGLLGTVTFVWLVAVILSNTRRIRRLAAGSSDPNLRLLSGFAVACRNSVVLLLLETFSSHTLYRYNWIWLAAFCMLAAEFAAECRRREELEEETPGNMEASTPELEYVT